MRNWAHRPVNRPPITPEITSQGRKAITVQLFITPAATSSCPRLWNTAATGLASHSCFTVKRRLSPAITAQANRPPPAEYSRVIIWPENTAPRNTRADRIIRASPGPSTNTAYTVTMLASPSFTP